jgi:alpha-beta hydrolase superfamily lysophospholipase
MNVENKILNTKDGFSIYTETIKPITEGTKTVVMCHGLTGNMDGHHGQLLKLADMLCSNGFKVIRFNFRGHEKSSGIDLDVNVESFITDLDCVIQSECRSELKSGNLLLFGFSFGGFAVMEYICRMNLDIPKLILWSPALNPNDSSFENKKAFCYQEIFDAKISGNLEKDGYVYWKAKDFKVSKLFVDQVKKYDYKKALNALPKNTMILQGINDKNVDKTYNEKYAKEYGFIYKEYDASHSLFEVTDEVVDETVRYFLK